MPRMLPCQCIPSAVRNPSPVSQSPRRSPRKERPLFGDHGVGKRAWRYHAHLFASKHSFVTDSIWYWLIVSDKPTYPQNVPAIFAKHIQVAFLRHRKRAKISTGNWHDLGSGNAKLQPEAARESCGEVCEVYSMQNHNLIGSNRHLQPTDGSAARSLYMGAYTPQHSRGYFISLLFF